MPTLLAIDDDTPPPPLPHWWWSLPLAAAALLVALSFVLTPATEAAKTSYDYGPAGYRGAYDILTELNAPCERSRKVSGGHVRWLFFPEGDALQRDRDALLAWVAAGNRLLLATTDPKVAESFGLTFSTTPPPPTEIVDPTLTRDGEALPLDPGTEWVTLTPPAPVVWPLADGRSLVSIVPHGAGELWLLNAPRVVENQTLRKASNAVALVRIAEAMRGDSAEPIQFDEYCHGLRDRPGVGQMLFEPPMRGVTLHLLAVLGLLLWAKMPRFGAIAADPSRARRDRSEFLDAMAALLHRKGDADDAFRTLQADVLRRLAAALHLPAATDADEIVRQARRVRGIDLSPHLALLEAAGPAGGREADLLAASHRLSSLLAEFRTDHDRAR